VNNDVHHTTQLGGGIDGTTLYHAAMVPGGRGDNPHHCAGNLMVGDNVGSINSGGEGDETSTMVQLSAQKYAMLFQKYAMPSSMMTTNDNNDAAVGAKICHAISKICHAIFDNDNNRDAAIGA
jgi:hypothetical protein